MKKVEKEIWGVWDDIELVKHETLAKLLSLAEEEGEELEWEGETVYGLPLSESYYLVPLRSSNGVEGIHIVKIGRG